MWQRNRNSSYFSQTNSANQGGGMVSGNNEPYKPRFSSGSGFSRRSNSSYFPSTSSALGGGGSVSGTSSPGGSLGKPTPYIADDDYGAASNRPSGGFAMSSGSFSKSDATSGPVNIPGIGGRNNRPRFFRRSAGGFAGLSRRGLPSGPVSGVFSGQQ